MTAIDKATHYLTMEYGASCPVRLVSLNVREGTAIVEDVWSDDTLSRYRFEPRRTTVSLTDLTPKA